MVNHPNRGKKARFTLTIVADTFGAAWDKTVADQLAAMVHLQKLTGLPTTGNLTDHNGIRIGRWAYKEAK